MTMELHIYRGRRFQWTWVGVNPLTGRWALASDLQCSKSIYYAHGYVPVVPVAKWSWRCISTGQNGSNESNLLIRPVCAACRHPQDFRNPHYALGHTHVAMMGKLAWRCTSTGQDASNKMYLVWIHPVVAMFRHPQFSRSLYCTRGHAPVAPMDKWPLRYNLQAKPVPVKFSWSE